MRLEIKGCGAYTDFAIDGLNVAVGGIDIDCGQRQTDIQVIIDIKKTGDQVAEAIGDELIASVVIPPAKYQLVETVDPDTGEIVAEQEQLDLSPDDVILKLWPV
jgi:hypothetical protein